MKRLIRKLRLRQGDIIVVNNGETAKRLMDASRKVVFSPTLDNIPIVIAPEGIHRLSAASLRKILARAEKQEAKLKTFLGAPDGEV